MTGNSEMLITEQSGDSISNEESQPKKNSKEKLANSNQAQNDIFNPSKPVDFTIETPREIQEGKPRDENEDVRLTDLEKLF